MDPGSWPLWLVVALFAATALVIAVAGTWLTAVADRLSEKTGLGQAVFGAVFLGGVTSLPGITTSVVAASQGHAELAVSNALGGIAAQTTFLAVADMTFRKVNLEHAAANVANLIQGSLLVTLLALPIIARTSPGFTLFGVHPISILLFVGYGFGVRLISSAKTDPMWAPEQTVETHHEDEQETDADEHTMLGSWVKFGLLAVVVALCGWVVATTGGEISARTGISESVVGTFLTAIATSLPELVTSIAAVRRGALTLAVGDILGGNCFDVLFIAAADVAYREGSIYQAISDRELFVMALTVLLTGTLLLGLLRREKHGIANIGFESFLVLVLYVGAFLFLSFG